MDDFRVGSVSYPDPYGRRENSGTSRRKSQKRSDEPQEEISDEFQLSDDTGESENASEAIEDYYQPSKRSDETE